MAEYIEREALLSAFELADYPFSEFEDAFEMVKNAPPADVAPVVHGEWEDYGAGVCCSKCGISLFHQDTNNNAGIEPSCFEYCPYCGAKMDSEG